MNLHSNLVIFKSIMAQNKLEDLVLFTFQSGDIQIKQSHRGLGYEKCIYIPIWWYSNHLHSLFLYYYWYYLHSNLVIFKSLIPLGTLSSRTTFTFQSGDIQINFLLSYLFQWFQIYIPIWWYSNKWTTFSYACLSIFTFQSGDIQICYKIRSWKCW